MQACDFTILTFQTICRKFISSKSGFLLLANCSFLSCHPMPRSVRRVHQIYSLNKLSSSFWTNKQNLFWFDLAATELDWLWSHHIISAAKSNSFDLILPPLTKMLTRSSDHSLTLATPRQNISPISPPVDSALV